MRKELEKFKNELDEKFKKLNIPGIKLIDNTIESYFLGESTRYTWGIECEFETCNIDIAFNTDLKELLWNSYVITSKDTKLSTFFGDYHHDSGGDMFGSVDDIIQWLYNFRLAEVLCKEFETELIVTKKENLLITDGKLEHVKLIIPYNSIYQINELAIHLAHETVKVDLAELKPISEIIDQVSVIIGKTFLGIMSIDKVLGNLNEDLSILNLKVEAENYDLILKDEEGKILRRKSKILLRKQSVRKLVRTLSFDLLFVGYLIRAKLKLSHRDVSLFSTHFSKLVEIYAIDIAKITLTNRVLRRDLKKYRFKNKREDSIFEVTINSNFFKQLSRHPSDKKYLLKLDDPKTIQELIDQLTLTIFKDLHDSIKS